jgi:ribosome-binding protein aMBF1 (putative translation factor)
VQYDAFIHREGSRVLAEFPDCSGCQTFATGEEIAAMARDALEGWLEAHLVGGKVPPRPTERARAPDGKNLVRVPVRAGLAAVLAIRWARQDAGLSQAELGRRAGVSQQQINKLEDPDENPKIETLEKVARALGLALDVNLIEAPRIELPRARRRAR